MTLQTVLDDIRKRPGTGDVIPIINPVTEEQIAEFTDCGEEAVNEAVARAKASFEAGVWSGLAGARAGQGHVAHRRSDRRTRRGTRPARLAEHRHAVDAGAVGRAELRRVLPLLRGMVLQDQRQRLRREDQRHRHGHLRRHARLHAQGALRRCGADLPVERADLQRVRQARARPGRRLQHASSSPPRRRRCRRCCWTGSSPRPACPTAWSTC